MGFVKKFTFVLALITLFVGAIFVLTNYYSYIFSKTVEGQVIGVDRVTQPTMVMGRAAMTDKVLYSFAVAVKDRTGKIFSGASEDSQWAIVEKNMNHANICATAKFYPYAPWDLQKGGTYFNVRLLQMSDCPLGTQITPTRSDSQPQPAPPATEVAPPTPPAVEN